MIDAAYSNNGTKCSATTDGTIGSSLLDSNLPNADNGMSARTDPLRTHCCLIDLLAVVALLLLLLIRCVVFVVVEDSSSSLWSSTNSNICNLDPVEPPSNI